MKTRFFALFFVVAGLALSIVMARQIFEALAPYGWQKADCLIQTSDVLYARESQACRHSLQYQYVIAGERKTASTWRIDPGVPPDRCSGWASFASDFPPASTMRCYVDPRNPDRAVLDRGNVFSVFTLILPIGLVGMGVAIFRGQSFQPRSLAAVKRLGQGIAVCVLLVGAAGTVFAGVLPLVEAYSSTTWNKAECEVLASRLRTSSGGGSSPGASRQNPGYYLDIVFTYAVQGRTYVSDRYDFSSFGSGRDDRLARIVEGYPPGAKVACAVRADNPYAAVLVPGLSARYLWGFLPLLAVLFGGLMLVAIRRMK